MKKFLTILVLIGSVALPITASKPQLNQPCNTQNCCNLMQDNAYNLGQSPTQAYNVFKTCMHPIWEAQLKEACTTQNCCNQKWNAAQYLRKPLVEVQNLFKTCMHPIWEAQLEACTTQNCCFQTAYRLLYGGQSKTDVGNLLNSCIQSTLEKEPCKTQSCCQSMLNRYYYYLVQFVQPQGKSISQSQYEMISNLFKTCMHPIWEAQLKEACTTQDCCNQREYAAYLLGQSQTEYENLYNECIKSLKKVD